MPSKGHGAQWPKRFRQAARALARAMIEGESYATAAKQAGISRASIFRWIKFVQGFHAELEKAKQRLLREEIYATIQKPHEAAAGELPAA
jgi:hypothetical protein